MGWFSVIAAFVGKVIDIIKGRKRSQQEERRHQETMAVEGRKADALERIAVYLDGLPQAPPSIRDLFKEGRRLEGEYRYREAIEQYQSAFQPQTTANNRAALHILIGNCFLRLSELDEALGHYRQAEHEAKEATDKEGLAAALGNMGIIYRLEDEPSNALEYLGQALDIFTQIGATIEIAQTEHNIQEIKRHMEHSDDTER